MNDIGLSLVTEAGFGRATVARDSSTVGNGSRSPAVAAAETGKTLPYDVAASRVSVDKIMEAAEELNRFVQGEQRDLMFQVHEDTGEVVVRVVDRKSGDLIRQIPNDVVLELAVKVREHEPFQLLNMRS